MGRRRTKNKLDLLFKMFLSWLSRISRFYFEGFPKTKIWGRSGRLLWGGKDSLQASHKATPHCQTHLSWPAEREQEKEALQNSPLSRLFAHLNVHEQLCVNMVWGGDFSIIYLSVFIFSDIYRFSFISEISLRERNR